MIRDMLDETQLILTAIGMPAPKRTRRTMQEIEPSFFCEEEDPIWKMAKKESKKDKRKSRPLSRWTNMDFVKYTHELLSTRSMGVEKQSLRNADQLAALYDKFVMRLQEKMNNKVLKDYIEWWVSTQAEYLRGHPIYMQTLSQDKYTEKFLSRYNIEVAPKVESKTAAAQAPEIDADTLFKMGGITSVLTSKGIVVACDVLKRNGILDFVKVSSSLQSLPKDVLMKTIETTIQSAPYKPEQIVDFVSLFHSACEFHGIKKFKKLNYMDYFRDTNGK